MRGLYGINIDAEMKGDQFDYLIADPYNPAVAIADGFTTRTIPAHTWAVFPCRGKMAETMQAVNKQIFSEWLPANGTYDNAANYPAGIHDDNYYSEVWIPIRKK